MNERLLSSIIALEKALQEEVREEEARARSWQERELAALAAVSEQHRRELELWRDEQAAAARVAAESEGAQLRAAAAGRAERLAALPQTFLQELLTRQLQRLLPEDDHDHPHGQG
jgi:hypothetical protein